jgi:hypothetical protein
MWKRRRKSKYEEEGKMQKGGRKCKVMLVN